MNSPSAQASPRHDNRRTGRWIDPDFQRRYALLLIFIVFLVSTILIGAFWFHSEQILKTLLSAGIHKEHSLYLLVQKQMGALLVSVCVVVGLFAIFVMAMSYFYSHRIVGPVYAIKRSLESMGRGDWNAARLQLRENDEFQDVATLLNKTVEQMQKKS